MRFPATNKIRQKSFGENAQMLQDLMNRPDIKKIIGGYFLVLAIVLITIFLIIATVRIALAI